MKHSTLLEKSDFKKLVDALLVTQYRMIYYDDKSEEILMESDEDGILEMIEIKQLYLEEGYAIRVNKILDDWYALLIYNKLKNEK